MRATYKRRQLNAERAKYAKTVKWKELKVLETMLVAMKDSYVRGNAIAPTDIYHLCRRIVHAMGYVRTECFMRDTRL